ncbi:hypothetical protein JOB18_049985 [Solea senegalensis]|uniref:Uncharacterized protein n=1 Tax=Solea senegalensis TaxID=28829 RepID=A0AAV6PFY6_SOLSE|nr:hypothetical protein JOB18_049985 [Solea senegalensis]
MNRQETTSDVDYKSWTNLESCLAQLQTLLQEALEHNACQDGKISRLIAKLEVETGENQSLSDQVEDLKAKLEVQTTEKWTLYDRVWYLKQQLEVETGEKKSLSDEVENFKAKTEVETAEKQCLLKEVEDFKVKLDLETREKESLSKQVESLKAITLIYRDELERLKDADKQQLEHTLQCERQALHTELVDMKSHNFMLKQKLEKEKDMCVHLQSEAGSLSTQLVEELKKNKALSKEKESFSAKLQQEKTCILQLKNQMMHQHFTHQQELQSSKQSSPETKALLHKVDELKAANTELATKLQIEEELTARLSSKLDRDARKNKCVIAELLQRELTLRQWMSNQFQKENDDNQQELEALHQKLDSLKVASSEDLLSKEPVSRDALKSDVCDPKLPEENKKTQLNFFHWHKKNKDRK